MKLEKKYDAYLLLFGSSIAVVVGKVVLGVGTGRGGEFGNVLLSGILSTGSFWCCWGICFWFGCFCFLGDVARADAFVGDVDVIGCGESRADIEIWTNSDGDCK